MFHFYIHLNYLRINLFHQKPFSSLSSHSPPFPKHLKKSVHSVFSPSQPVFSFRDRSLDKRHRGSEHKSHTACIVCRMYLYLSVLSVFPRCLLKPKRFSLLGTCLHCCSNEKGCSRADRKEPALNLRAVHDLLLLKMKAECGESSMGSNCRRLCVQLFGVQAL